MKFVEEIKNYAESRKDQIEKKEELFVELKEKLTEKEAEIKNKENEYKVAFDESVFEELKELKAKKNSIQSKIDDIRDQIGLMDVGTFDCDVNKITKEIEDYIKHLNLVGQMNDILKMQNDYVNKIDTYLKSLNDLSIEKEKVWCLRHLLTQEARTAVNSTFIKYYGFLTNGNRKGVPIYDVFEIPGMQDYRSKIRDRAIGLMKNFDI